jgi:hypothetical protein
MFWELTRPAACHALALRMVDEIWAASDHGRAIYADSFDGPIGTRYAARIDTVLHQSRISAA